MKAEEFNLHLKKCMADGNIPYDGEVWINNEGHPHQEYVINGRFLLVKDMEFRLSFTPRDNKTIAESLKLTRFHHPSGISEIDICLIFNQLKWAINLIPEFEKLKMS